MSEYPRRLGVILACEMVKEVICRGAIDIDLLSPYGALQHDSSTKPS